jgi:hypothetical protein
VLHQHPFEQWGWDARGLVDQQQIGPRALGEQRIRGDEAQPLRCVFIDGAGVLEDGLGRGPARGRDDDVPVGFASSCPAAMPSAADLPRPRSEISTSGRRARPSATLRTASMARRWSAVAGSTRFEDCDQAAFGLPGQSVADCPGNSGNDDP